ncbi:MAG: CheB methylesterase domain-containing protein [Gammaproteobacteria bacterium]|nr:CheB methylesterase domain-containing protein [Gammaproteobacteria bacterium]
MPSLKHLEPKKIILIGASTGGPGHIKKILSDLQPEFKATIIIAQHMGNEYIPSFSKQLNSICQQEVSPAISENIILPSHIYVSSLLTSINSDSKRLSFLIQNRKESGYNPDIDYLFTSAAQIAHKVSFLGIILTGIGDDGATGCKLLSEKGGECIAENETSAIVYGMPRQTKKINPNTKTMSLDEIIKKINLFGHSDV